jgi:hypothetical protein
MVSGINNQPNGSDLIVFKSSRDIVDNSNPNNKEALTTQRSCLLLGFSVPWLPNLASKTAINAILSLTKRVRANFFWAAGIIASVKDCAALLNSTSYFLTCENLSLRKKVAQPSIA